MFVVKAINFQSHFPLSFCFPGLFFLLLFAIQLSRSNSPTLPPRLSLCCSSSASPSHSSFPLCSSLSPSCSDSPPLLFPVLLLSISLSVSIFISFCFLFLCALYEFTASLFAHAAISQVSEVIEIRERQGVGKGKDLLSLMMEARDRWMFLSRNQT